MFKPMRVLALATALTLPFWLGTALAKPQLPAWPQATSDVPADPSVVFGTLPNGMRYAIKKNTMPAGQVSLRLRIAVGSMDEVAGARGIAHFIEHMAFRGTTHLPDGEAIKMLQSLGLSLAADANASTGSDQTVYQFDLPAGDDATLDKGLLFARDIASEVTFEPKAVDSERAVVLAELRQRDTPNYRAQVASTHAIYGDDLANAISPGGKPENVGAASADLLKKFYQAHYRPKNAVVIVVGDIDPKSVEAKIKASFSNWVAKGPAGERPIFNVPMAKEIHVNLFAEAGANSGISIQWVSPYDAAPDSLAREARDLTRLFGLTVLNQRLQEMARSANPPFINAGASRDGDFHTVDVTRIGAVFKQGGVADAAKALSSTYVDAAANGIGQDEVDRAVNQLRAYYQSAVAAKDSTASPMIAFMLLHSVESDDVFNSPEQNIALFEKLAKDTNAANVSAALKDILGPNAPVITVSTPVPVPGGEATVTAALTTTASAPAAAAARVDWPYTSFGPAGTVGARDEDKDLGLTFLTFSNGVRATIKPTKFQGGQIMVFVRFGDGRFGLSKFHTSPSWAIGGSLIAGGLKRISLPDMQKSLAGKIVGLGLGVQDDAFVISGSTRPEDYTTELQLMAAYFTDAAWRPEAFQQVQSGQANALGQAAGAPGSTYALSSWAIAHSDNVRYRNPTLDEITAAKLGDVKALVEKPLASGPVEVIVVGDIAVDNAIAGLAQTFGALPKHEFRKKPLKGDERLPIPQDAPVVLRHGTSSDKALASISWGTDSYFADVKEQRVIDVLEQVLFKRLFDELRSKEGMTYSPQMTSTASWSSPGFGYLGVSADVPTDKVAAFYAGVERTVADLRATEILADELQRARDPSVKDTEHAQENNGYWAVMLGGANLDRQRLEVVRTMVSDLKSVTAADVHAAAQKYLIDSRAWKVIVLPKDVPVPSLAVAP